MKASTLNPDLHVGPARWRRPGPRRGELVRVIYIHHRMGFDVTPSTTATIRRIDNSIQEDVPGNRLENTGGRP